MPRRHMKVLSCGRSVALSIVAAGLATLLLSPTLASSSALQGLDLVEDLTAETIENMKADMVSRYHVCASGVPREVLVGREFGLSEVSAGDVKHAPFTYVNKRQSELIIRTKQGTRGVHRLVPSSTSTHTCEYEQHGTSMTCGERRVRVKACTSISCFRCAGLRQTTRLLRLALMATAQHCGPTRAAFPSLRTIYSSLYSSTHPL